MSLSIFASFIGFCILLSVVLRQQKKRAAESNRAFWEREAKANSVRRKPLDDLNFIQIPLETFPTHVLQQDETVLECISIIEALTSQKIVNLTGYTNTDLKLKYGTATITELSEYDQNYTILVRTLQKWSDILLDTGYVEEAAILLQFAVSTGTDVCRTYEELADYWISRGEPEKLDYLIARADALNTSTKVTILRKLREKQHTV